VDEEKTLMMREKKSTIGPSVHSAIARKIKFSVVMILALAALHLFSKNSCAQVVDPVTTAQAPVPGVGHHYIGMGTETVNPADGSVNFDLPIQTPAGRGLSFPFGIHYAEAEPFYLSNNAYGPNFGWVTPTTAGNLAPFDLNGWSYQLPNYQAQAFLANTQTESSGCSSYPNCPVNYCWGTQNYSFSGFDGHKHPLAMAYLWVSQNSPQPMLTSVCDSSSYTGLNGGVSSGGDNGVATGPFGTVSSSYAPGTQPPFTVTERSGTVYQFPQGPSVGSNMSGVQPFGMLAQTITDRNGNQISLNGTSSAVGGAPSNWLSGILPAGSYTDTLGRTILSWTGLGGITTGQQSTWSDQLNVYGVGQITVNWTTTSVTFPDQSQNSTCLYLFPANTYKTCGFVSGPEQGITMTVASAIILPNGQQYSFTYGNGGVGNNNWGRLSKITFPDGGYVRYVWGTNSQSKATYQTWPLDASIPYAQGNGSLWAEVDTPAITDRYVSYDGTTEVLHQSFSYHTHWIININSLQAATWDYKTTTVTSYDLVRSSTAASAVTTYTYTPIGAFQGPNDGQHQPAGTNPIGWQAPEVPVEASVVYQDGSGNALKTVNKAWFDQYVMTGDQAILDNGQATTTLRCVDEADRVWNTYEYNFQSAGPASSVPTCPRTSAGLLTWGISNVSGNSGGINTSIMGSLLRQTATAYHTFSGTNILDELDSVSVFDGSGSNQLKQTIYGYDATALTASGVSSRLLAPAPGGSERGNATSVSRWLNTTGSTLTTTYTYYDTGQVQSMTDPCGNNGCSSDMVGANHTTTYSYMDSPASGTAPPSSQTNAYLTLVTNPLGRTHSFTWDYSRGLLMSSTDQNTQTANYTYNTPPSNCTSNDGLYRLSSISYPDGGLTTYCYTDWLPGGSFPAASSILKSELENTSGTTITSNSILDGMGHTVHTQSISDPAGADVVDTVYNGLGQVYTVSNPYRNTSNGLTTYAYDGLGRTISQTNPDGSSQQWSYSGNTVISTDENGNQWQRTSDALGRLINVLEPNGATTIYSYDALDNLLKVNQNGNGTTDTPRTPRTFTYDSVSRLLCASNPENSSGTCPTTPGSGAYVAGTTGYSYDANGNVASKTDARSIITSYFYDALNRLYAKNYNSGDPSACMQYDNALASATGANFKGRLTAEWTAPAGPCPTTPTSPVSSIPASAYNNTVVQGYDSMGHTQLEQQCPSGSACESTYQFSYLYDLAGNTVQFNNGLPAANSSLVLPAITWGNTWNAAGQLQSLTVGQPWPVRGENTLYPTTLIQAISTAASPAYDPMGHLINAQLGVTSYDPTPAINVVRQYDNRGRIVNEADGPTAATLPTPASEVLTVSGSDGGQQVCTTVYVPQGPYHVLEPERVCNYVPDTGTLSVTIAGFTSTASYGGGSSDSSIAAQLAAGLNAPGSPVTATVSGSAITVTANATGPASDYSVTISNGDITVSAPSPTLTGGQGFTAPAGSYYSYQVGSYAPNGNILSHTDSVMGAWNFSYDSLNRLTSANASSGGYAGQFGCWIYDSFGNRTLEAYSTASSMPCANMTPPQATANNQLPTLTYDAAGNVYQDGTNTYAYDAEGRLCAVLQPSINGGAQFQYLYDAAGARVGKATFTGSFPLINKTCAAPGAASGFSLKSQYLLDLGGDQITELDGSGNWVHSNAFEGGRLSATYDTLGLHFAIADPLGTKRVEGGTSGCATSYLSLPYGDGLTSGTVPGYNLCNLDATEHHFTGKERDTESGNDYFGARYYASSMGRFMSPDPTFLNIRKVFNPQRWNLYSYSLNDPLGHFDPDGEEAIAVTYPGYQVGVRGSFTLPLGHGGVVLVEKDGTTHYFEYGRYHGPDGEVRNAGANDTATPPVQRDASGNITQDSMNNLLQTLSGASGKGGAVDALVIPTTSAEDENILTYLKARQAENGDPNRQKYSLWAGHNCGTLSCEALSHAGMNAPTKALMRGTTPYGNFLQLWALYGSSFAWEYQPKEHVTHRIFFPDGSN
jgi:RHS repeat-associated protein